jgi:hypothetical protein
LFKMRSDVQHWVLCELRVLSRKVAAFEKQSRGVCVADTVCDDVLLLDGPQKVADVSIAQRIPLDKCVISECLVLPFIPTFNAEIKPRVCNVPGTRFEFNANAVPFFPLAAEEIGIHVEASHGCSGNGFSGVRAPADMALNLALVTGLEDDLSADVLHAEAGSVPDHVSPEPEDLVVHAPGGKVLEQCSSIVIGKSVHHNRRKATTQVSTRCNSKGDTLRERGFHHNHRNATTQVPGRCNSEVGSLRDRGASRKDAAEKHAPWSICLPVGRCAQPPGGHQALGFPYQVADERTPTAATPKLPMRKAAIVRESATTVATTATAAAAFAARAAVSTAADEARSDEEEEDGEHYDEDGRFWKHISPSTSSEFDKLENIGSKACVFLHGHVVKAVLKRLHNLGTHTLPVPAVAELGAKVIIHAWQKRDLSPLLRLDYDGLVTTLADILGDTIIETVDEIDESSA